MPDELEKSRAIFKDEAHELVEELESALLEMEESPDDEALVGRVFRAMHTLKGSGSMFGFDDIAAFTHDIESVFDMVRSGRLKVTKGLTDLTLASLDQIGAMLGAHFGGKAADAGRTEEISASYRRLIGEAGLFDEQPQKETTDRLAPSGKAVTYKLRFKPSGEVMQNGTNPLNLLDELRSLGVLEVSADTGGIPSLEDIKPDVCYTGWDMELSTRHCIEEVKDVFIFVEDDSDISVKRVDGVCAEGAFEGHRLIGDILIEKGEVTPDAVERALRDKKRIGDVLLEMGEVTPDGLDSALEEQKIIDRKWSEESKASIRVASDKLDVLADLVGEMVTAQARLQRMASNLADAELTKITEEMEKLTEMLRGNTLSMRMVPFGTTFTKFKRLVRDLSRELGKDVAFSTWGGETELDKTVIERLSDPLMHIIRNCIDHGIETPEGRGVSGKPRQGKVRLSASQSGGKVVISISDDGSGLDTERIRRVAVDRGIISPDDRPSDSELYALTLSAGFSTAENVSSVSGRGVGMDVVKRCMDALRGTVEIYSRKGVGTTLTLKLPLTLAIIDGLLVSAADSCYVIPLNSVSECVERINGLHAESLAGRYIEIRGELVPTVRLRDLFGVPGKPPPIEYLVIVEEEGKKAGVAVDLVVGEHQTVIKPLSRACKDVEGISGATILGDGGLALILDMAGIVRSASMGAAPAQRAA